MKITAVETIHLSRGITVHSGCEVQHGTSAIMTADLVPKDGRLPLPPGPGLGIELAPEMFKRPDVTVDLFTA